MPHDINPFEPWRPRRDSDDEPPQNLPDDDLLRPWRSGRDRASDPQDEPQWYRQPRTSEPAWTPAVEGSGTGIGGFVWLTLALLVVALVVWGMNGSNHVSRVGTALIVLWTGLLLAMVIGRGWRWWGRLSWVVCGLAAMVLCWLFVPTMAGNSYWRAESVVARTRQLAPGDVSAFNAQTQDRREISEDFTRLRSDLREAERSWVRRTVDTEVRRATQERDSDPVAAMTRLKSIQTAVMTTEHYGEAYQALTRAKRDTLDARVQRINKELSDLIAKKQHSTVALRTRNVWNELNADARELNMETEVATTIRELRQRNALAWAIDCERILIDLKNQKKYSEVATVGSRLVGELRPEVESINQPELTNALARVNGVRKRALTARVSAASDLLAQMVKAGQFEKVPGRATEFIEEFRSENSALDNTIDAATRLRPTRELALTKRSEKAVRELDQLLQKKEYTTVATRGDAVVRELDTEGRALSKTDWRDGITSIRRRALVARLDTFRETGKEQLKKRQYQALASTGEKAYTELALEAEAVALSNEVETFRATCRFTAKLARDAGEEDGK